MSKKVHRPPTTPKARARRTLLRAIGERVRALRDSHAIPRRALAEMSGVSARFLAQLEQGEGNISIGRLADVAQALRSTPAALLAPAPEGPAGAVLRAAIDGVLLHRSEAELAEIRAWLESRFSAAGPTGHIVALLGVRGAGKSSIGRRLAARLGLPFHELDDLIATTAGLTLAEIFELHGEAYYRRVERETLASFLSRTPAGVLATGGSLVTDPETFKLLRRRALTVWLKARPEDHWNRVLQQGDQRPMAENPHAMQELRALLAAREKQYAEAELVVDTSDTTVEGAADQIADALAARPAAA